MRAKSRRSAKAAAGITALLASLMIFTPPAAAAPKAPDLLSSLSEEVTVTTEFETESPIAATMKNGHNQPAMVSHKGYLYTIWANEARRPFLSKINLKKPQEEPLSYPLDPLDDYVAADDGHHHFSLAIDKKGYLHVSGDMHNFPAPAYDLARGLPARYQETTVNILYWVSDAPLDISSFTFMGADAERTIPGKGFSYGSFYTDLKGELVFVARIKSTVEGHHYGEMGVGLYIYDPKQKVWTPRGALAPPVPVKDTMREAVNPTIAWEDNGQAGTNFYQTFAVTLYFDQKNRMHIAIPINNDNNEGAPTDILYAYSDDLGETFQRIEDDSTITLPMRAETGPNQASIVPTRGLSFIVASAFADVKGNPGISYTNLKASNSVTAVNVSDEITEQTFWDPTTKIWSGGVQTSAGFWIRQRDYVDKKNVMTSIGWDAISRTAERGKEGYVFRVPELIYIGGEIDIAEFRKSGDLRVFGMTSDHKMRIVKISFSPAKGTGPKAKRNGITFLSDLAASAHTGAAPSRDSDATPASGQLALGGISYGKGLGMAGESSVTYNLGGTYDYFLSDIGIDQSTPEDAAAVFKVFVDGTLRYHSGTLHTGLQNKHARVRVTGANELRLELEPADVGGVPVSGNWGNARLQTGVPTFDDGMPDASSTTHELNAAVPALAKNAFVPESGSYLRYTYADPGNGWASGWMADPSLTSPLDQSYTGKTNVERAGELSMYRRLAHPIDLNATSTRFLSYELKITDKLPLGTDGTAHAGLAFANGFFGVAARSDGSQGPFSSASSLYPTITIGDSTVHAEQPIATGIPYLVTVKLATSGTGNDTAQMKLYSPYATVDETEPTEWGLSAEAAMTGSWDVLGLTGTMASADPLIKISELRMAQEWSGARHQTLLTPPGVLQRVEAESMQLTAMHPVPGGSGGYSIAFGSGSDLTSGEAFYDTVGHAESTYTGPNTTTRVRVVYTDQPSGDSVYALKVGDALIGTWVADDPPAGVFGNDAENKTSIVFPDVDVRTGDRIELIIMRDGTEKALVDYIDFGTEVAPPGSSPRYEREFFSYPAGTALKTTTEEPYSGWATGWKADQTLQEELGEDYTVTDDHAVERTKNLKMYRGLLSPVNLGGNATHFFSYKMTMSGTFHPDGSTRSRMFLDREVHMGFGTRGDGVAKMYPLIKFGSGVPEYGDVAIEPGVEYTVAVRITARANQLTKAEMKVYGPDEELPASAPESWDVTKSNPVNGTYDVVGVDAELHTPKSQIRFDDLRKGNSWESVTAVRKGEHFFYEPGTLLNTTIKDSFFGWNGGWKPSLSLTGDLDDTYTVSPRGGVERASSLAMFRELDEAIDLRTDDVVYLSYKTNVSGPVSSTAPSLAGVSLSESHLFGFTSAGEGGSELVPTLRWGDESVHGTTPLQNGKQHMVVVKLTGSSSGVATAQMLAYPPDRQLPKTEPGSWQLASSSPVDASWKTLGVEANLHSPDGVLWFDDLRRGASWEDVTR